MNDEINEMLANADLNENGIADKVEVKNYFKKVWAFIKKEKVSIILGLLLIGVTIAYFNKPPVIKEVVKTEIVKKNNILQIDGNHLVINLEDMYLINAFEKSFKKDGKKVDKFRVAKGIEIDGKSIYITIDEPMTDEMTYNMKEFKKYISRESKGKK